MLKDRARTYIETLWTAEDPGEAERLIAPDFSIQISGSRELHDFAWYLALIQHFRKGIRELSLSFHQIMREGPKVATHYTFTGQHHERVFGIDARDNTGHQEVMSFFLFNGGRITRQTSVTDFMSLKRQMLAENEPP